MASWIKMRTNLDTDPRVVNIAAATGQSVRTIVGCLHFLWSLADEHTTDGKLRGYTVASIDHMTVSGFAAALQVPTVKWLEVDTDGFVRIPDFKRHNGESAKRRARNAVRAAGLRDKPRARKRAQDAHETSTESAPRAEQEQAKSRAEKSRDKYSNAALPVRLLEGDACSLLQGAKFDDGAIRAILGTPGVDECRVQWAICRWLAEGELVRKRLRDPIKNNRAYIRDLITGRQGESPEWRAEWQHKRIASQASSLKLSGATA
jgi:hypothetical protein